MITLNIIEKFKNIALLLSCLLFPRISSSQVFTEVYDNLINHFQDTVISLSSTDNFIIHGIENKLYVRRNLFPENVDIQFDNQYLLSKEGNYYILRAPDPESKENIALYIISDAKVILFSRSFTNEKLPAPQVYVGRVNLTESKILPLQELHMADSLFIFFGNSLPGCAEWLKIRRFTVGYNYGSYYISNENTGNKISAKTKSILLGLTHGQEVSITILAEGTGSIRKEIPLLYFKIESPPGKLSRRFDTK